MDATAHIPRLGVIFDRHGVQFLKLAQIGSGRWRYVWIIDSATPADSTDRRLMRRFGDVIDIAGLDDDAATELVDAAHIDGITCFSDRNIVRAAAIASRLSLRYHPPIAAARLSNKLAQRRALDEVGLPGPAYLPLPGDADVDALIEMATNCPFPAVCKPQEGAASFDAAVVDNLEDLRIHLTNIWRGGRARNMILEEFIRGRGTVNGLADFVSVECAVFDGTVRVLGIHGKSPMAPGLRETGDVLPSGLSQEDDQAIAAYAVAAATAIGVTDGCLHTEIKLTLGGPRLIEVNGRVGGGSLPDMVFAQTGVAMRTLACEIALGLVDDVDLAPSPGYVSYFFRLQAPLDRAVSIDPTEVEQLLSQPGVESSEVLRLESAGAIGVGTIDSSLLTLRGRAANHSAALKVFRQMQSLID
ncbi:MAG: ATP-grasp domain-containing protein [Nocardiaceae bacterium]|nr:ATP-grasp domain-containing protein [Nocardiaceae bacterium]